MRRCACSFSWSGFLLVWITLVNQTFAEYIPFLEPGFFFDYNIPSQPVPLPITAQCETIHISWSRQSATGPSPVAPYYLQVYTSNFVTPFIVTAGSGQTFDWVVPFAPGTLYQICMVASNGVTGGCQSMYTVIENITQSNPTCQNVTFPPALNVVGMVSGGNLSQYAFVNQCTDLSVTPTNGTPPFILTVSPSLHPPYNITSNSMGPITWTVSLSWAFPFFLSLVSSEGFMWTNGPMHSGGPGSNDCLAPDTMSTKRAQTIAAGAGIGSLVGGALLAILFWYIFVRYQSRRGPDIPIPSQIGTGPVRGVRISLPAIIRNMNRNPRPEPFSLSFSTSQRVSKPSVPPAIYSPGPDVLTEALAQTHQRELSRSRTYVIHRDGGRAPASVITADDDEVVELPPEYIDSRNRTMARSSSKE